MKEPIITEVFKPGAQIAKLTIGEVDLGYCFVLPLANIKAIDPNFLADATATAEQIVIGLNVLASDFLTVERRDEDMFDPNISTNQNVAYKAFEETSDIDTGIRSGKSVIRKKIEIQIDEPNKNASRIIPSNY